MTVIVWACLAVVLAIIIFLCGPALLQIPLIAIEVADFMGYLVKHQVKRWKESWRMLREVFLGEGPEN